ncbi:unnamed protein product [Phytomonas sp. EM1]|nr:unnamed protein product [Phytomonas sp. EM1]|eukprot:CCW63544.1 unnamed protein product [Phytomonas sp. isolate EM1]
MNALSQFLKELDPSQIDEAVELLQRIKGGKEPSISASSYNLCSKSDDSQILQVQSASVNSNFINSSQGNCFSNYTGINADEIPLMYTRFARSSDIEPIGGSNQGKAQKTVKKTTNRKKSLNFVGQLHGRAHTTIPFHQEGLTEENVQEINRKAVSVKTVTPVVAIRNLNSFGFLSGTAKATSGNRNRMFPLFVQDKRQTPEALQFWKHRIPNNDKMELTESAKNDMATSFGDEEFSLLHPPMCLGNIVLDVNRSYSFNDFVESEREHSYTDLKSNPPLTLQTNTIKNCMHTSGSCSKCPCLFHSRVAEPYKGFNSEVIFYGFFAVGYDPCQARPPYFGTCNHLQGGSRTNEELEQIARFPVGEQIPQFSTLDYDYDSGDDWDVMDGEDIGASSSSDSNSNGDDESFDSSDLDFINDDDIDSDCELYRRIIEARKRRLNRLRGKDKLVPLFSGPFVAISVEEHPLRRYDRLELMMLLSDSYLSSILEYELQVQHDYFANTTNDNSVNTNVDETRQQKLMRAALKNRREMTADEINAVHDLVNVNGKVCARIIVAALREQHMCVGVARAEIERTVKRFYERKRGILVRRNQPWLPTDERLFSKSTKQRLEVKFTENFHSPDFQSNDEGDAVDDDLGALEDNIDASGSVNSLDKPSSVFQVNEGTNLNLFASKGDLSTKNISEVQ